MDLGALKTNDDRIINQRQLCPSIPLILNFVQTIDFFIIVDRLCSDVEHLFQCYFLSILHNISHRGITLSHECRCIQCCSHEHSPSYRMFGTIFCNIRHSFLSNSHLVLDFVNKFCCVTSHDELFKISLFLGIL